MKRAVLLRAVPALTAAALALQPATVPALKAKGDHLDRWTMS